MTSAVAGRYANALFELASEENAIPAVSQAMEGFSKALAGSGELRQLIESPILKTEDQMGALEALAEKGKLTGLALNFVKLMCQKRRLSVLPETIAAFQAQVAQARGEVVAEVVSAEKLSAVQMKDLTAALQARMGTAVTVTSKIDSSLLGGLVVKIGSTLIDDSLKTKLQNLKVAMKGTG